jgi:methionyl-tRNA synthetase
MSKTEGNFIGMEKLRGEISNYGLDSLRYYLLRASCFGNDLNWVDAELARSFSELSNTVGNCLQRTLKMVARYRNSILPARGADSLLTPADRALINQTQALLPALSTAYEELQLQRCALLPVELARAINVYIETTAPFQLAKDPAKARRLDTVLNLTTQGVYTALAGLLPILPHKAQEGLNQLQVPAGTVSWRNLSLPLPDGHALSEGKPLFQRA